MTEKTILVDYVDSEYDEYKTSVLGNMESYLSSNTEWKDITPNKFFKNNLTELKKY
jgi:hypothetical protein